MAMFGASGKLDITVAWQCYGLDKGMEGSSLRKMTSAWTGPGRLARSLAQLRKITCFAPSAGNLTSEGHVEYAG